MNKVVLFFREVLAELSKITWPKKQEFIGSTIIVIVFVIFFSIILGAMDLTFSTLLKKLLGYSNLA